MDMVTDEIRFRVKSVTAGASGGSIWGTMKAGWGAGGNLGLNGWHAAHIHRASIDVSG